VRRECTEKKRKRQYFCFNCGSDSHSGRHCLERKNDPLNLECDEIKIKEKILPVKYTEREFEYDIHNLGGFEAIQIFSANYDLNVKKIKFDKIKGFTYGTLIIPDIDFRIKNFRILGISITQMKREVAKKLHRRFHRMIIDYKKEKMEQNMRSHQK
jgi:hypothetical protein